MTRLMAALIGASLIAGAGGTALAQDVAAGAGTYDTQQLPAFHGKVAQFSLTPRGDVDGLILDNGTEVLLPPHLGTELVYAVKPGDSVTVHGLKARVLPLIQAQSITDDATGRTVTDTGPAGPGPRGPGGDGPAMQAQGTVKMRLYGPRGDLNGVLLTDGTMIHLPPPEAQRLADQLAPGKTVWASGDGVAGPLGKSIGAREIGPSASQAVAIAAPPPHPHGHRHPPPPTGGAGFQPPAPPAAPGPGQAS